MSATTARYKSVNERKKVEIKSASSRIHLLLTAKVTRSQGTKRDRQNYLKTGKSATRGAILDQEAG
jgi:hypothetical protein